MNNTLEQDQVRRQVQERYGAIAQKSGSCCGSNGDDGVLECGTDAERLGYSADDVVSVPEGSEMGLGCGNPTALASIKPGETILDLGSGGRLRLFSFRETDRTNWKSDRRGHDFRNGFQGSCERSQGGLH